MSEGKDTQRKGLLADLSVSQLIASAGAAVTSTLLASQIGIAGSIIGVAVASVVSTVASQLYRGMLTRSADKLAELRNGDDGEPVSHTNPYGIDRDAVLADDATVVAGADELRHEALGEREELHRTADGGRMAPTALRVAAAQRRQATIRRRATAAAAITSLVAVAVTALLITALTHGEGIGSKPVAATVSTTQAATTTATTQHATSASPTTKGSSAEQPNTQETLRPSTPTASDSTGSEASDGSTSDSTNGTGTLEGSGTTSGSNSGTSDNAATSTSGSGNASDASNGAAGSQGGTTSDSNA